MALVVCGCLSPGGKCFNLSHFNFYKTMFDNVSRSCTYYGGVKVGCSDQRPLKDSRYYEDNWLSISQKLSKSFYHHFANFLWLHPNVKKTLQRCYLSYNSFSDTLVSIVPDILDTLVSLASINPSDVGVSGPTRYPGHPSVYNSIFDPLFSMKK